MGLSLCHMRDIVVSPPISRADRPVEGSRNYDQRFAFPSGTEEYRTSGRKQAAAESDESVTSGVFAAGEKPRGRISRGGAARTACIYRTEKSAADGSAVDKQDA